MLSILADDRERESGVITYLEKYSPELKIKLTRLKTGDYQVFPGSTLVERKTVDDFCLSIIDGRLFRQAYWLKAVAAVPLILIEGNWQDRKVSMATSAINGALLTLAQAFQLPIIYTQNPSDTANSLVILARQRQNQEKSFARLHSRAPKRTNPRRLYVLQALPGVGQQLALDLLLHFGSIRKIFTAGSRELQTLPGIGPKRANRIVQIINSVNELDERLVSGSRTAKS